MKPIMSKETCEHKLQDLLDEVKDWKNVDGDDIGWDQVFPEVRWFLLNRDKIRRDMKPKVRWSNQQIAAARMTAESVKKAVLKMRASDESKL